MKPPLESEISATICEYLSLKMKQGKLMFWRNNNVPVSSMRDGQRVFRSMPKYSLIGVSDIIVVKEGWAIFLEVKRKGTKQSEGQIEFEKLVKKNGAEYHVVRSLDEVIELGL